MNIEREQECKEPIGWCKSEEYPNLIIAKFLQSQQQGRLPRMILWVPGGCLQELSRKSISVESTKLRKVCSCHSSSNPLTNSPSSITKSLAHKLLAFAFKTCSFPTYHISFLTEISAPVSDQPVMPTFITNFSDKLGQQSLQKHLPWIWARLHLSGQEKSTRQ